MASPDRTTMTSPESDNGERGLADNPTPRANWPHRTAVPQRYGSHYAQYQALGGLADVAEDALAFAGAKPLGDIERIMALSLVFDQIHKEGLSGDFAELGVYTGSTATLLARYARRLGRTLWLLDTFEGFDKRDFTGVDSGQQQAFTDTSLEAVRNRVGSENTVFIDGYFPETARRLPDDGTYCLVHLDADLYSPIMSGLEYFYPRMVPGGFMIIHDYGSLSWAGAEKAVDTFFADKPECLITLPDGAGSAVIRRQRPPNAGKTWLTAQQIVEVGRWYSLAKGRSAYVLVDGWSTPEDWGVWGVGQSHKLHIVPATATDEAMTLECDVWAYTLHGKSDRPIDVIVDGEPFETWRFPLNANRAIRSLRLSGQASGHTIEFRPQLVVSPKEVDPSNKDGRPLGLAMSRFRLRDGT